MLLNRLIEQQQRLIALEVLSPIPDFEPRRMDYILILDPRGAVVGFQDGAGERIRAPVTDRSANIRSNLLWDTAEYVLGMAAEKKGASAKKSAAEKAAAKLGDAVEAPNGNSQTFLNSLWLIRERVKQAGESYPALDAIIAFYEGGHHHAFLNDPRLKPVAEKCAEGTPPSIFFALLEDGASDDDFEIAVLVPGLDKHLVQASLGGEDRPEVVCSVTGERGPLASYHGMVKGVLGGAPTGTRLVSFNEGAGDSFGFSDAENCVTTISTARGYHRALNHMLSHYVTEDDRRHYPHHYLVGDGNKMGDHSLVVWSSSDVSPTEVYFGKDAEAELLKLRRLFRASNVESLQQKLQRRDGGEPEFFFAGLRANNARLANVMWREMTAAGFWDAAERWYADLATDGPNEGDRRVVIWKLAKAVMPPDTVPGKLTADQKAVKGAKAAADAETKGSAGRTKKSIFQRRLEGMLFRAAISPNEPLPAEILSHVIRYCKTTLTGAQGVSGSATQIGFDTRLHRIASLIKLALARSRTPVRIPVSLDPAFPNGIYHIGRLFALCEKAQERAVPGADTTIFSRFAGAMASPAFVMVPVLRKNSKHLDTLRRNARTLRSSQFFQNRISEVAAQAPVVFPTNLTLQDQGIFFMGYQHERNELRRMSQEARARAEARRAVNASELEGETDIGSDDVVADAA